MENLGSVEAIYTHAHTGIVIKINKNFKKIINIELFSNVLFLHVQKYCKKYILLNSFLC